MKRNSGAKGFTLIEILIAISIFALLAMACNAVLQTVMRHSEATKEYDAYLKSLGQGMSLIERDLTQMVARNIKNTGKYFYYEDSSSRSEISAEGQALTFYRLGWNNPNAMLPRGQIQMVTYRVKEGKLERLHFVYPEVEFAQEPDKDTQITVLYENVEEIRFRFKGEDGWRKKTDAKALPHAIAMEIIFTDETSIERKFLVANAMPKANKK